MLKAGRRATPTSPRIFYFKLCTCSQRQSGRAINEFKLENLLYAAKLLKAGDRQWQQRGGGQ